MAADTREVIHERRNSASLTAWLALVVAVVALILAVVAYNRTGANLESQIRDEVNEAASSVEENTDNQ